jgi:hypothetical protein
MSDATLDLTRDAREELVHGVLEGYEDDGPSVTELMTQQEQAGT